VVAQGRLDRLRYLGIVAAVLLAVGAYASGALPGRDPGAGLRGTGLVHTGWQFQVGLGVWLAGTLMLTMVWQRLGTELSGGAAVGLRWQLGTGLLWAIPLLVAPPLASRDIYSYACQGWMYGHGLNPYTIGAAAGNCPWLDSVSPVWRDASSPYGPFGVILSAAASWLGSAPTSVRSTQLLLTIGFLRLLALAGAVLIAVLGARLARACGVPAVRVAWLGVITPLVAIHLASGAHHDGLMTGLLVAGLAVAVMARRTTDPATAALAGASAGLLLGLAAAVKITAVVALPFAVLLTAGVGRAEQAAAGSGEEYGVGRGRAEQAGGDPAAVGGGRAEEPGGGSGHPAAGGAHRGIGATAGLIGACVVVFAAVTLWTGLGLGWLHAITGTAQQTQWTSIPTGVGMCVGYVLRVLGEPAAFGPAVAAARLTGLAVLAVAAVMFWARALRHRDDIRIVVVCCGATFTALTLLSPVFYPWYALTPLALLAASTQRESSRRAMVISVCLLTLLVLPNGLGLAALTKLPGAIADTAAVAIVIVVWLRRQRHRRAIPVGSAR
jgi:hypothetical protein